MKNINYEIVDEALNNGELFTALIEYTNKNHGVVELQKWYIELRELLGLNDENEANTALGKRVGYLLMRIKAGTYGDINIQTDYSGTWLMDYDINSEQAVRIHDNTTAQSAAAQKELKAKYRKELTIAYKLLDNKNKQKFKKPTAMDVCISFMMIDNVSAKEALNLY